MSYMPRFQALAQNVTAWMRRLGWPALLKFRHRLLGFARVKKQTGPLETNLQIRGVPVRPLLAFLDLKTPAGPP